MSIIHKGNVWIWRVRVRGCIGCGYGEARTRGEAMRQAMEHLLEVSHD